jgi:hypothetical protein
MSIAHVVIYVAASSYVEKAVLLSGAESKAADSEAALAALIAFFCLLVSFTGTGAIGAPVAAAAAAAAALAARLRSARRLLFAALEVVADAVGIGATSTLTGTTRAAEVDLDAEVGVDGAFVLRESSAKAGANLSSGLGSGLGERCCARSNAWGRARARTTKSSLPTSLRTASVSRSSSSSSRSEPLLSRSESSAQGRRGGAAEVVERGHTICSSELTLRSAKLPEVVESTGECAILQHAEQVFESERRFEERKKGFMRYVNVGASELKEGQCCCCDGRRRSSQRLLSAGCRICLEAGQELRQTVRWAWNSA